MVAVRWPAADARWIIFCRSDRSVTLIHHGGDGGVNDNGIISVDSNSHDGVGCVSPLLPRNHFDVLLGLLQYIMVIIMDNRKITLNNLSL